MESKSSQQKEPVLINDQYRHEASSILSESEESDERNPESEIVYLSKRDSAISYEDITAMASIISRSSSKKFSIEFCDCSLTSDHLKLLCDKIKDEHCQITTLAITYKDNIDDLLEIICFIIWKYATTSLSLEYDELNDRSVKLFEFHLKAAKIDSLRSLDISYNSDISEGGFEQLGEVMKIFNIVSLKATDCEITDEKLKNFLGALHGVKLKQLDISCNGKLAEEGFRALAKFVAGKGVDRLELSSCKLSEKNIEAFNECLPQNKLEPLLEELDVSFNFGMGTAISLGLAIVRCGVTKIRMAGCKLREEHLVCLRESLGNHKMELVNIRDNSSISPAVADIVKLVKQCEVKELNVCDCWFSAQELECFRALGGTKVRRLHLGDKRREPDEEYIAELCALLANDQDVLYLRFHKLSDDFRILLQNNCSESAKIKLTVGDKKEELRGNKGGEDKTSRRSVNEKLPLTSLTERPQLATLQKNEVGNTNASSENHSSTSLRTKHSKWQHLEQPLIESTEKRRVNKSTESMTEEYSPTLEKVSPKTEGSDENNLDSEIQVISIHDHAISYEDVADIASKILNSSKKFSIEFRNCSLTVDDLKCLRNKIQKPNCQITTFAISFMDTVDELLEETCFIIRKYETTSLSLVWDNLNDQSVKLFKSCCKKTQIESLKTLDISYNSDVSAAGFKQLGKIMRKFNIVSLKATDCDITDEKLKQILDALHGVKLKELDISCNGKLTNEGFATLAKFVACKGVDRLELSSCKLSKKNIEVFSKFLPQTRQEPLIEEFDVSYNSTIEPDTPLGSVVVKCGVTKLSIAGCKLSEDNLICLRESMKYHKLELVNVRDNASISQGTADIAKLVKQCNVKELNVSDCLFSAQELKSFRKALGETKVCRLHLGDKDREPDENYIAELCALLANVKDVLYLRLHKLCDNSRHLLQNSCSNSAKINLTIADKKEELHGKKGRVETGSSVIEKVSPSSLMEKSGLAALKKNDENANTVNSSKDHLPVLSRRRKFNFLNLEQRTRGSTEEMLQEYSSTLGSTRFSTENIEDVFVNEIVKIFKKTKEFNMFARSEKGLHLGISDIRNLGIRRSINIDESEKMAVLKLWRKKNEPMATPGNIREIVKRYYNITQQGILTLGDGRFRAFRNRQLNKQRNLFLGEMLNSTGYQFCSVRLLDSNDTQACDAAKLLLGAKHENIVSVLDVGTYHSKQFGDCIYIVTELTWTLSLKDILDKSNHSDTRLHEQTALSLAEQLLLALDFCHSHYLICSSLSPENIMISDDKKHLKVFYSNNNEEYGCGDGSLAPKVIFREDSKASNIFTTGIILAQIFSAEKYPPSKYNNDSCLNIDHSTGTLFIPNKKEVGELITHMLDPDPENRPTATQVLSDITFFRYPYKATEDKRNRVLIQRRKSANNRGSAALTEWISDENLNFWVVERGERHIAEDHDVQRVVMSDRQLTERDIPRTAGDERAEKYVFEFWGCHITNEFLNSLYERTDLKQRIAKLKITNMKPGRIWTLVEMICSIVKRHGIKKLSLEYNHLNDDDIDLLHETFRRLKICNLDELDISHNEDITSAGFEKIGDIIWKSGIKILLATACDVTDEKLKKFLESVKSSLEYFPLKELNLSCNPNLTTRGYAKLAGFVANGFKSLNMSECELTKEIIDDFCTRLRLTTFKTLEELDVSYNSGITPDTSLGSIIVGCGIKKLNLAGCEFGEEHFVHIKNSTAEYELGSLCISDNHTIGDLGGIAELVKHWNVKELDISDCMLSASALKAFREKLDGAKLRLLHLGDADRVPDASYMEETGKLLSNVTDVLHLQFHKLNSDIFQLMQNHAGQCPRLMVKFSDGTTERWTKYEGYTAMRIMNKKRNYWL